MLQLCISISAGSACNIYCQNRVWTSSFANPTPQAGHFLCRDAIRLSRQPLQNAAQSAVSATIKVANSLCIHLMMTCCLKFCSQHEHFNSFYSSALDMKRLQYTYKKLIPLFPELPFASRHIFAWSSDQCFLLLPQFLDSSRSHLSFLLQFPLSIPI